MRVVVAGAGFAGLLAADRIARAGHEVVVLEAVRGHGRYSPGRGGRGLARFPPIVRSPSWPRT